jgi:hypothetical protein
LRPDARRAISLLVPGALGIPDQPWLH